MKKHALFLVAASLLVAIGLTGCGGTKTDGTATGTTGTTAVTLKIGIGAPLTDGAVELGQGMKRAALLAIDQANNSAELKKLGITLKGVEGDDRGDPKTGANIASQFASDKSLIGVMGHLNSGVSGPNSKIYAAANIVEISPASTNPALTQQGLKNFFRTCTIDSVQGPAAATCAYTDLGKKTVFIVDDATTYGVGLADEFEKKFKELGGTVAGKRARTTDKQQDFKAVVSNIKAANADIVYYGGIYNAGALLSKQMKDAGLKIPMMGGDGLYDAKYIELAGAEQAEGDFASSVGRPLDQLPKGAEFQAAYKVMWPNDPIAAYDAYSYDATNVIIQAIEKVATDMGADKVSSVEGKKAVIAAVAATNMDGVTGKVAFDANGDTVTKDITVYTVKGGKWTTFKTYSPK